MKTKQQLEASAESVISSAEQSDDPKAQFCMLWTSIIRPALEIVKLITGPKVDELINKLENAADKLCDGTNGDVAKFCEVWKTLPIKGTLRLIQNFTGPKVDKAIDKFILVADSLCPA